MTTANKTTRAPKAKPMIIIEDTAEIKKAIVAIEKAGKKLDMDIQRAGVSCLVHINNHGDTTLLDSLVNAMPKGSRKSALVEWAVAVGKVRTLDRSNPDDMLAIEAGRIFKLDRTKSFDLADAMAKMWYDFKPEKDLLTTFDLQAQVNALIKRYNNAVRDGAEIENVQSALSQLDTLRKQWEVLGTEL